MTRTEREVLDVLGGADGFLPAQEIHARLRRRGARTGLTSVYRAVQSLTATGELDVHRMPGGEAAYRRCGSTTHHHHLVCSRCGETVEVAAPAVERWVATVARDHDFRVTSHTLEITGLCARCTSADPAAPSK